MPHGVVRCECHKRRVIQAKIDAIPERFRDRSFDDYRPLDVAQSIAKEMMSKQFLGSYFIYGGYARGKTHLAYAQYRWMVELGHSCLFVTMQELIGELRRAELDHEYFCMARERVSTAEKFHLFIDDIDKFKVTDFKFEVLYELINTIYVRKLGLTVTSNWNFQQLVEKERLHPAVTRRLDDICKAVRV